MTLQSQIVGIIPARAGSKSIKNKNLKMLGGKPMIAYTIEAAKQSRHIGRVIVTTEDEGIASVAKEYGAEVPFLRPKELAEDHVTDLPVFQHVLHELAQQENYFPKIVVQLRPTSPLRRTIDIDGAIELFLQSPEVDCVRTVTAALQHPLKMWRIEDGSLVPFIAPSLYGIEEAYNQPRQKLPKAFVQNGAVDVIRAETILEKNSMSGSVMKAFVMDEDISVNVDSPIDFELAELALSQTRRKL
ncbi:MAG: hypothetical protein COV45_05240 [Deltaproteobacteria bacterium CG11_big_fil_rev_8_21_14_0_20_47_16]|nr:MAG: hypothetical protein COV45_05240 [Deltaproteobacteria bacterium CG11_big_fil_rev_8_21_14_0_20_47_16]